MSRLVSLTVENFQPHRHRVIDFDESVTVLVGANGSGKSSVIRAIRWVAFNRPLGDSVIRWGSKHARVKLVTETAKIVRERGEDGNYYRVNAQKFTALGTGVPESVHRLLRLEEICFQKQIEAGFWFTHSAPEVAREMNRVVDLDVIDRSQSYATGKLKAASGEVKVLEGLLGEVQKKEASLSWVPKAERLLKEHDRIAQERDTALRRLQGMSSLLEQIREAQGRTQAIPDTSRVDAKVNELRKAKGRLEALSHLLSETKSERERLWDLQSEMKSSEGEVEASRPATCESCGQPIPKG
jgi:exonuclease SbcC